MNTSIRRALSVDNLILAVVNSTVVCLPWSLTNIHSGWKFAGIAASVTVLSITHGVVSAIRIDETGAR